MNVLDRDRNTSTDELLSQYLERELDDESASELGALLAQDTDTREELDFLREMVDNLGQLKEIEAPPQFVQQVRRRVRRQRKLEQAKEEFQFRPPYEVIAVLIVAAIAVLFFLLNSPPT